MAALADRYSVGVEAVKMMLDAVARGGGSMAQFNLPEFGGNGQWMRGGMTMVGDMFNNSLKATVDNLCNDLSKALENQPSIMTVFAPQPESQSQSQGSGGASFWQSSQSGSWWPSELGSPSSTGSQNSLRYAYFPGGNRLAIDDRGRVEVYDTSGYDIGGFGQQQSGDASITFTSQRGVVRVDGLPRVTGAGPAPETRPAPAAQPASPSSSTDTSSLLALIEQLGQLKEKGLLTDEEFAAKKSELLKRL
ncbi:MAG: SHOCT domain-containing protein [Rhodomicrobium sp.]